VNSGSGRAPPRFSVFAIDEATGALTAAPNSPFDVTHPPPANGEMLLGEPMVHRSGAFIYLGAVSGRLYGATADASGDLTEIPGMPVTVGVTLGLGIFNDAGRVLYLPHDNFNGMSAGAISAYLVEVPSGVLTRIASYSTGGRLPTMAALTPTGEFLLAPNSNTGNARGSVAVFIVDAASGTLTAVAGSPFATGAATIPTAVTIHSGGRFVYTTNSNGNNASTITAFQMDVSTGFLTTAIGSPFPTNGTGATAASIDPAGKFLFVSNHDSNSIQGFAIDSTTGALTKVPGSPFPTARAPSRVSIDPSGKYLYCANAGGNSVSAYAINATTGALRLINTVAAGNSPGGGEQVGLQ